METFEQTCRKLAYLANTAADDEHQRCCTFTQEDELRIFSLLDDFRRGVVERTIGVAE